MPGGSDRYNTLGGRRSSVWAGIILHLRGQDQARNDCTIEGMSLQIVWRALHQVGFVVDGQGCHCSEIGNERQSNGRCQRLPANEDGRSCRLLE